MWRRAYLFLVLVRLYFSLSPSYLHPDENFQGPEVIAARCPRKRNALVDLRVPDLPPLGHGGLSSNRGTCANHYQSAGQIFSYPVKLTWEFTADDPLRSVFPLWPIYGLPMLLLRWLWIGNGHDGEVPPIAVFWTLRVLMFTLSFVLEDWALHELVQSPRSRKVAVLLVASSYVTWTYQTHTFSNSIETLALAWCLVLIDRIVGTKVRLVLGESGTSLTASQHRSSAFASAILASIAVFGIFNRITFPAFLVIPGLRLIPHFIKREVPLLLVASDTNNSCRPLALFTAIFAALLTTFIAVYIDTQFYTEHSVTWSYLFSHPVITPLNNFKYNLQKSNLAEHGLHPWYQHVIFNLPQLLGPAAPLIFFGMHPSLRLSSAIAGVVVLSIFQHQEARFLLPTIPMILSSIQLPRNQTILRLWAGSWILFNVFFGILMGVYHQGGIVPTQVFLGKQPDATHAIWWKTYSPPIWLLNGKNEVLTTHDMMGMKGPLMLRELAALATCHKTFDNATAYLDEKEGTYLIAPLSATFLDNYISRKESSPLHFLEVWRYRKHLNLDDLDFGDDGFANTLSRVVGRRGLGAWRVTKDC
ncbi:Alg9-like mannosyltransferase [Drepanopeziza brunnea f. sp. 'multigermtubi' MB_m1]|uniref:Mannosyltransferase n=1 Tax=Marssonina brunnea f. sp. multigermtubi (strain MB_m1) TaxID=1072389 RepID=K1WY03_MARBU|nr:Alg9-like mannosyltransferase [Drepanopeziza brunnea f. sp. 'multigermtubi' MB_m1]EKD17906.1 Alg9-like mannosyltransferase [Drepanopeziza brunnea f. sp. 'multigermtubi' MB_m1]